MGFTARDFGESETQSESVSELGISPMILSSCICTSKTLVLPEYPVYDSSPFPKPSDKYFTNSTHPLPKKLKKNQPNPQSIRRDVANPLAKCAVKV